jgi:Predicted periplasmic or secreted lipoprotein
MSVLRLPALLLCLFLSGCVTMLDATSDGPLEPDPGRRTFGAYVDDQRLETVIKVNLRKSDPALAEANINVLSFNGVVLLTGEVPSSDLRQAAGEIVRAINKVRQVHNELLVKANSTFFSRSNDNWLATKLRSKILASRDIESERVKIVVENRVVFLMGLLTREEANLVSEIAARTEGVEKVVRVIEYIERR